MAEERTPNFDNPLLRFDMPDTSAPNRLDKINDDKTAHWALFTDVTELVGHGYSVTVTGISNSEWYWLEAYDSNSKRVTWAWCSNDRPATLICDPSRVLWICLAWQDGKNGGYVGFAYTYPAWWR